MGLTFKRQDELEKMLDKFAIIPDDPKKKAAKKPEKVNQSKHSNKN